jgi:hypothetical protein
MNWLISAMTWKMSTKNAGAAPGNEIELASNEKIRLVGPAMHGWIYRSCTRPAYYRLLPVELVLFKDRDHIKKKWQGKLMHQNVAVIKDSWADDRFFYVCYDARGLGHTLLEALANPDPCARLNHAARALRALPSWWTILSSPLFLMPSEITYTNDCSPVLLALPSWPRPNIGAVFAEPQRGMYLAPELVCARDGTSGERLDLYALGVSLLQCVYRIPPADEAGAILFRAASGTAFARSKLESSLPFWLEEFDVTRRAISIINRMVSPDPAARSVVDPESLAGHLEQFSKRMDPVAAAIEMRDQGRPRDAFALLENVLLMQESYDLLVVAGELAGEFLNRPLEAVEFFERAIARKPQYLEAYKGQFKVIARARDLPPLRDLIKKNSVAARDMDSKIERDFQTLHAYFQSAHVSNGSGQEAEEKMARYWIWRQMVDSALDFIYPRLFDGEIYLWWKFGLNLIYADALILRDRLEDAEQQLLIIKHGLQKARSNGTVPDYEIQQHGEALADLEVKLLELKRSRRVN